MAIHIHNDYQLYYPDLLMMFEDPTLEDHNGDLIQYIAGEEFCGESSITSLDSNLGALCGALENVYTPVNLSEIDGFVSYVKDTRKKIEEIQDITSGHKFNVSQILLSNGAGQLSCFPVPTGVLGFTYQVNWHQLLYQDGTFPDDVNAKVGTTEIGSWENSPDVIDYGRKPDFAHLSHMHITVDEI